MLNLIRFTFLTFIMLSMFTSVQLCAPYFNSLVWQNLENQFKNMTNVSSACKSQYVDTAASTVFTGQKFCTDIFATKLFLAKKCNADCQKPPGTTVSLSAVNCNTYKLTGDGSKPENIVFQFQCIYTAGGVQALPCTSPEFNFQQVQQDFATSCVDQSATAASAQTTSASAGSAAISLVPITGPSTGASAGTATVPSTGSAPSAPTTVSVAAGPDG